MRSNLSNRVHATWTPALTASTDAFISTPFLTACSSLQPPSGRALPVGFVGLKNLANQEKHYLADGEIHVWLADLTLPADRLATLAATLTVDEQERAARFRFPEHRDRFIAARGGLRELLGAYLGDPAAALRFRQGVRGKPALAGEATGLHFNLSHSGNRVLYAVARREVGVDLEAMDRRVDEAAVAERVCTVREWTAFQALPAERQRDAFFACWTRKEAVAKAIGEGLASGLNTLDACFREDAASDGRVSLRDAAGREWSVLNVPMESGWAGALAAAGTDWRWTLLGFFNQPGPAPR